MRECATFPERRSGLAQSGHGFGQKSDRGVRRSEASTASSVCVQPAEWRASKPYVAHTRAVLDDPTARLPHSPMVLHRGGWPDGF